MLPTNDYILKWIIHDQSVDFPSAVDELSQYVTNLHRVNNTKIILVYVKYYFVLK